MREILNTKYGELASKLGDIVFQISLLEAKRNKIIEEIELLNKAVLLIPNETKKVDNKEIKSPGA